MTPEEKQLLLKDICARLPYGVKVRNVEMGFDIYNFSHNVIEIKTLIEDFNIKPYLRPMSSMTEEEIEEYTLLSNHCISTSTGFAYIEAQKIIEWLIKNMFDYCGLIEKGLALEAPEGMY